MHLRSGKSSRLCSGKIMRPICRYINKSKNPPLRQEVCLSNSINYLDGNFGDDEIIFGDSSSSLRASSKSLFMSQICYNKDILTNYLNLMVFFLLNFFYKTMTMSPLKLSTQIIQAIIILSKFIPEKLFLRILLVQDLSGMLTLRPIKAFQEMSTIVFIQSKNSINYKNELKCFFFKIIFLFSMSVLFPIHVRPRFSMPENSIRRWRRRRSLQQGQE